MTNGTVDNSVAWKRQGALLSILLLVLGIAYYQTFESIVSIWLRSDTFAHGFIIAPISCWLVWRIRSRLSSLKPVTNYLGIPLLVALGLVWLLATYIDILAIAQLAVVAMIPVLVFSLLGWQVTTATSFPLFFLMLSVPVGEELTPVLIDFTADFTVALIKLSGIPIFREGNYFQLPTGNWSVVAACSGVRYLIASVTLGLLYAYLNYQSMLKRGLFVIASFVVPIIANGLRAFLIVMLGHLSDMQIATGVDHLIYGWFFFGIVIGIMFYIGSFWRDEIISDGKQDLNFRLGDIDGNSTSGKVVVFLSAVILMAWPLKNHMEQQTPVQIVTGKLNLNAPVGWSTGGDEIIWSPSYKGFDVEYRSTLNGSGNEEVYLFVGYYADQRQGSEIGNYNNVLVHEKNKRWRVAKRYKAKYQIGPDFMELPTATLTSGSDKLVTSYFFYVDGKVVTHKYETKLFQAKAKLVGDRNDGAVVFISTRLADEKGGSVRLLSDYLKSAFPDITSAIDRLGKSSG
ncbi:MAG: exosortase A [Sedimenticola sp.]